MSLKIGSNISKTEIKQGTLGNDYKNGDLKYVDIELKIVSLKGFYVAIHISKLIIRLSHWKVSMLQFIYQNW